MRTSADRLRRIGLLPAAAFTLLVGCDDGGNSYFPLAAGWEFGYRTELHTEGAAPEVLRWTATNLPRQKLGDTVATPQLHQDGRILFYAADAEGVRLVGFEKRGEDAVADAPGQYILKYPLEAGTKWHAPGRTVLLTERFLYSKALPINIGIDLDYAVEKTGENVRVPAGHFFDCVKVTATGQTTVNTGDNQRTLNVVVELVEWYAPGVGLVKSTRTEKAGEERAGNARMVSELEYAKRPSWFD